MRIYTFFLFVVLLPILMSGCGDGRPARVSVSGVVHVDGKPLEIPENHELMGFIRFYPLSGGRPAQAKLEKDGTFLLGNYDRDDGCPKGDFKIELNVTARIGKQARYLVPPRYENADTSGIRITITDKTSDLVVNAVWNKEDEPFRKKIINIEDDCI